MAGLSLRRMRLSRAARDLSRQVRLSNDQFVQPLFAVEAISKREPVPGLPDVWRDTADSLLHQIEDDLGRGVNKFLLFNVPAAKSADNFDHTFGAQRIEAIRQRFGSDLWLAVDVCLCSSTDHGHCGVLDETGTLVVNESSVDALTHEALIFADAGADCVAPSDMMDGRVGAIREALDTAGLNTTSIMSYAVKFNSGFYGPFRVAADSAPAADNALRDRSSYQLDPGRSNEALLCALRDAEEGADMLMVKPALPYLDILSRLSEEIPLPWAAYQTSGEAAGLELVSKAELGDRKRLYLETWTSMARAGASTIISYAARNARQWLND